MTQQNSFVTVADSDQLNSGYFNGILSAVNSTKVIELRNHIRTLIDRTGVYSFDGKDAWGEAFTSNTGRNGSVDTGNTTAIYNNGKYYPAIEASDYAPSGSNSDSGYTNPNNAFDANDTTTATYAFSDSSISSRDYFLGKTFASAVAPASVKVKATWTGSGANTGDVWSIVLQGYNGSTWSDITVLATYTGNTPNLTYNNTYQDFGTWLGYRVAMRYAPASSVSHSGTASVYTLEIRRMNQQAVIKLNVPAGMFIAGSKSTTFSALYYNWESGASVSFELKSAGADDTGYLTENQNNEVTAFVSQANTLLIRLNPKAGTPKTGYPAIYGGASTFV